MLACGPSGFGCRNPSDANKVQYSYVWHHEKHFFWQSMSDSKTKDMACPPRDQGNKIDEQLFHYIWRREVHRAWAETEMESGEVTEEM